jgi:hypothetical protein
LIGLKCDLLYEVAVWALAWTDHNRNRDKKNSTLPSQKDNQTYNSRPNEHIQDQACVSRLIWCTFSCLCNVDVIGWQVLSWGASQACYVVENHNAIM